MKFRYFIFLILLIPVVNAQAVSNTTLLDQTTGDITISTRNDDTNGNGLIDSLILELDVDIKYTSDVRFQVYFQENYTFNWIYDYEFFFSPTTTGLQKVILDMPGGGLFSTYFSNWTILNVNANQDNGNGYEEQIGWGRIDYYLDYITFERPDIYIDQSSILISTFDSEGGVFTTNPCECVDIIKLEFTLVKNVIGDMGIWANVWNDGADQTSAHSDTNGDDPKFYKQAQNYSIAMEFDVVGFYADRNVTLNYNINWDLFNLPDDRNSWFDFREIVDGRMFERPILYVHLQSFEVRDTDSNGNDDTMHTVYSAQFLRQMDIDMGNDLNFWGDDNHDRAEAHARNERKIWNIGTYTIEFDLPLYDLYGKNLAQEFTLNWYINLFKGEAYVRRYDGSNSSSIVHGTYDKPPIYIENINTYPGNGSGSAPYQYMTVELMITSNKDTHINFNGEFWAADSTDHRWLGNFWFDFDVTSGTNSYQGFIDGQIMHDTNYIGKVEMEIRFDSWDDNGTMSIFGSKRYEFDLNFNDYNAEGKVGITPPDDGVTEGEDTGPSGPDFDIPAPGYLAILPALIIYPVIRRFKK